MLPKHNLEKDIVTILGCMAEEQLLQQELVLSSEVCYLKF